MIIVILKKQLFLMLKMLNSITKQNNIYKLEYEFTNLADFLELAFEFSLPKLLNNKQYKISSIVNIINNIEYKLYINEHLLDKNNVSDLLYMGIEIIPSIINTLKSKFDLENNKFKLYLCDYAKFLTEQEILPALNNIKKGLIDIKYQPKLKLEFTINPILACIIISTLGYLQIGNNIFEKNIDIETYNIQLKQSYISKKRGISDNITLNNYQMDVNKVLLEPYNNIQELPELVNCKIEKYYYM